MHFDLSHTFDVPLNTLASALTHPSLAQDVARHWLAVEKVDELEALPTRVWRFQANAPPKWLAGLAIAHDMLAWEEHFDYRPDDHSAIWRVTPCHPYARQHDVFSASGQYQLQAVDADRSRRRVWGELTIRWRLLGRLVERAALREIQAYYEAEAKALRMRLHGLP